MSRINSNAWLNEWAKRKTGCKVKYEEKQINLPPRIHFILFVGLIWGTSSCECVCVCIGAWQMGYHTISYQPDEYCYYFCRDRRFRLIIVTDTHILCTHRREVYTFIALIPLMQIKKRNTELTLTRRNPSRFSSSSSFTRFVCLITHLNYNLIVFFKLARRYLGLPPPSLLPLFGMQTKPVDYPVLIWNSSPTPQCLFAVARLLLIWIRSASLYCFLCALVACQQILSENHL